MQCNTKSTTFISDCIYPGMEVEWKYNNTVYKITGTATRTVNFNCTVCKFGCCFFGQVRVANRKMSWWETLKPGCPSSSRTIV